MDIDPREPPACVFPNLMKQLARDLHQKATSNRLDKLDNLECINAYSKIFQSNRRNLLLMVADNEMRLTSGDGFDVEVTDANIVWEADANLYLDVSNRNPQPYEWICNPVCSDNLLSYIREHASVWNPYGKTIQYCLSQSSEQHCKLQFSLHIASAVVITNLIKVAIMYIVAFGIQESPY